MDKRRFLETLACALSLGSAGRASAAAAAGASPSGEAVAAAPQRLAMAWRARPGLQGDGDALDHVGIWQVDWERRHLQIAAAHVVPGRAHGLLAEPGGGFLAAATRPGRWLLRCDAQGRIVQRHELDGETPWRGLGGHIAASADGRVLYTTETDPRTDEGWVSVRDGQTLAKLAEWPSHGMDPHHCVGDSAGALLVANGGIARHADGRKRDLERMDPSLVRLDASTGRLLGQWRLGDPRLSVRHLAWRRPASGSSQPPLLGVALQAEHDDLARRREAPALAVWDGRSIQVPSSAALAGGYAGDIAPGPGGGFVLSGQHAGRAVLWHPDAAGELFTVAELSEVCALAAEPVAAAPGGLLLCSARGVARWHPRQPPAMLAWPGALVPDNHGVLLG